MPSTHAVRKHALAASKSSPASGPSPVSAPGSLSTTTKVALALIAFRTLNAFSIRTFFQPDEFFQVLEPAWQMAFGPDSGAWITWEWDYQLRSSLHPVLFAVTYRLVSRCTALVSASPQVSAQALLAAPKLLQALIAAAGDFYTWRLAERIHGSPQRGYAWTAVSDKLSWRAITDGCSC
jgi:phosphatidylinositol glycan class B